MSFATLCQALRSFTLSESNANVLRFLAGRPARSRSAPLTVFSASQLRPARCSDVGLAESEVHSGPPDVLPLSDSPCCEPGRSAPAAAGGRSSSLQPGDSIASVRASQSASSSDARSPSAPPPLYQAFSATASSPPPAAGSSFTVLGRPAPAAASVGEAAAAAAAPSALGPLPPAATCWIKAGGDTRGSALWPTAETSASVCAKAASVAKTMSWLVAAYGTTARNSDNGAGSGMALNPQPSIRNR